MSNLLVIGGSSFLGSKVVELAEDVCFTYKDNIIEKDNAFQLDLNDVAKTKELIENISPKTIVFCSRFDDVETFGQILDIIGNKRFIFISSDAVFGGISGSYSEKDRTHPITTYGHNKNNFENLIREKLTNYVIVRPGYVLGKGGKRSQGMIKSLMAGEEVSRYNDFYRTPIEVGDFAKIILELINKEFRGTLHVANSEVITPYSLAKRVAEVRGFDKSLVKPGTYEENPNKSQIPQDATLNTLLMRRIISFVPKKLSEIEF